MGKTLRVGLQLKISIFVTALVILTSVVFALFAIYRETEMINKEIINKGMSLGSALYGVAVNNINNEKYYTLEEGFQAVTNSNKDVRYLMLVRKNGEVVVHSDSGKKGQVMNDPTTRDMTNSTEPVYRVSRQSSGEEIYDLAIPVNSDLEQWGIIRIGLSNAQAQAEIDRSRNSVIIMAAILAVLGIIGALFLGRSVTGSIKTLVKKTNEIAAGDFTGEIQVRTSDETGVLSDSVNIMLKNVRSLISQVKTAGQQVLTASRQLSSHSSQTVALTSNVAEAISQVAVKNSEQAGDLADTSRTIEQLNLAISQIASGAHEQAQYINQTSTLINEMAVSIKELASNSENIEMAAAKTSEVAQAGVRTVAETMQGMDRIKTKVFNTAAKLKELSGNSEKIGEIIMVIDEIADQTNLLALNAAIEAARAGEYGKGFAVVADEVRKLAERSGKAAREIADLVKVIRKGTVESVTAMEEGIKEVENGTGLSENAHLALKEIIGQVNSTNEFMQNVSAAVERINKNSEQVVAAIENLAAIAEENSASTQEMAAGSDEANQVIARITAGIETTAELSEKVSASTQEMVNTSTEIANASKGLEELARALELTISKFKI